MPDNSLMDRAYGDHPIKWLYANTSARTGATGFASTDIGRMAWQQDNDTFWVLKDTTPTWVSAGGAGAAGSDTNIQYNNNGVLAGASQLYWDETNKRFGYGVSAPTKDFHLKKDTTVTMELITASNNAGNAPKYQGIRKRGTNASPLALQNGDTIFQFLSRAQTGAGDNAAGQIRFIIEGSVSPNFAPTRCELRTARDQIGIEDALVLGPDYISFKNKAVQQHYKQTAANYTTQRESIIGVTDTTAARTITIASADIAFAAHDIIIKDESGGAATNNITIATEGSENIDGQPTATINTNYGVLRLYSDGSNLFVS